MKFVSIWRISENFWEFGVRCRTVWCPVSNSDTVVASSGTGWPVVVQWHSSTRTVVTVYPHTTTLHHPLPPCTTTLPTVPSVYRQYGTEQWFYGTVLVHQASFGYNGHHSKPVHLRNIINHENSLKFMKFTKLSLLSDTQNWQTVNIGGLQTKQSTTVVYRQNGQNSQKHCSNANAKLLKLRNSTKQWFPCFLNNRVSTPQSGHNQVTHDTTALFDKTVKTVKVFPNQVTIQSEMSILSKSSFDVAKPDNS